ncbi:MAG: type II secretion system protein [Candidatus Kerfeldbacteria bacterium]|nr:type II secretion system protein [Candidatus Kerfeldbacteria bacterium]
MPMKEERKNQANNGFTLIELLVVIAIIGILASIGLVALGGARERARDTKRQADLSSIRSALVLFFDDNSERYPPTNDQTVWSGNSLTDWSVLKSALVTGVPVYYAAGLPIPPNAGITADQHSYFYFTSTPPNHFFLSTQLESGNKYYYFVNDAGISKTTSSSTSAPQGCDSGNAPGAACPKNNL